MKRLNTATILCLVVSSVYSWETDNFTHRRKILKAPTKEIDQNLYALNDETNRRIHHAIDEFNEMDINCGEDLGLLNKKEMTMWGSRKMPKIYMNIKDALGGGLFGAMEKWSEDSDQVKKYGDGTNIYGGFNSMIGINLQTAFNLNGYVVGPDKLGHFVDQGFELFSEFKNGISPKLGFDNAMKHSNEMEDSYYGIHASGVKSYGDMAANYSGMKFWYNLTGKKDSFLKCDYETGKYAVNRDFDWAEFADDSWDQGINCSTFDQLENPYKNGQYKNKAQLYDTDKDRNLREYLDSIDRTLKCPDDLTRCQKVAQLECANYFVSPKCLHAANKKLSCNQKNYDDLMKVVDNGKYKYNRKENSSSENSRGSRDI